MPQLANLNIDEPFRPKSARNASVFAIFYRVQGLYTCTGIRRHREGEKRLRRDVEDYLFLSARGPGVKGNAKGWKVGGGFSRINWCRFCRGGDTDSDNMTIKPEKGKTRR